MSDDLLRKVLLVEAQNDRTNWVKKHKPNIGPYTAENPKVCVDCGKPLSGVEISEPCNGQSKRQ